MKGNEMQSSEENRGEKKQTNNNSSLGSCYEIQIFSSSIFVYFANSDRIYKRSYKIVKTFSFTLVSGWRMNLRFLRPVSTTLYLWPLTVLFDRLSKTTGVFNFEIAWWHVYMSFQSWAWAYCGLFTCLKRKANDDTHKGIYFWSIP